MRKALISLFVAAGLLVAFTAGCKDRGNEADGGTTGDSVNLGLFVSTTGAIATFGLDTKNGAEIAVAEINEAGGIKGKKINLVFYDTESKAESAGNAATKLATQDKVLVAMGAVASGLSLAAAPVFQANKIPMVSPSSTNPTVTEQGDYIFRVCYLDDFQGGACAVFAYKDLGKRKAAILANRDDAYSTGLANFFKSKFEALGGKIVTEQTYAANTSDFNTQVSNIKGSGADIIFAPVYYTDMSLIAKQVKSQGINVPMLGGDGWESDKLVPEAGDALEGSYFGNHYSQEDKAENVQSFVKKYTEKHGKAPTSLAALGYDVVYFVKQAIEVAGDFDRAKIRDAMAGIKDFKGVTGTFSIDKARNARKPISMLQIKGDRFMPVRQIKPEEVE